MNQTSKKTNYQFLLEEEFLLEQKSHLKYKKFSILKKYIFCFCGRFSVKHSVYEKKIYSFGGLISKNGNILQIEDQSMIIVIPNSKTPKEMNSKKFFQATQFSKIIISEETFQIMIECLDYYKMDFDFVVELKKIKNSDMYEVFKKNFDFKMNEYDLKKKFLKFYEETGFYVF